MTPSMEMNGLSAAFMVAFGITASASVFAGGMFLAIAFAFLVMAYSRPEDRKSYWLTLASAVLFSYIAALLHNDFMKNYSLHLVMGVGGALSKFFAAGLIKFGRKLQDEMGTLPEILRKKFLGDGEKAAPPPPPPPPGVDVPEWEEGA